MTVFIVHHTRARTDGDEDVKLIGVYSTEGAAQRAIEELSGQPGFSDYRDGFDVSVYEVDATHWRDGFETVDNDET